MQLGEAELTLREVAAALLPAKPVARIRRRGSCRKSWGWAEAPNKKSAACILTPILLSEKKKNKASLKHVCVLAPNRESAACTSDTQAGDKQKETEKVRRLGVSQAQAPQGAKLLCSRALEHWSLPCLDLAWGAPQRSVSSCLALCLCRLAAALFKVSAFGGVKC